MVPPPLCSYVVNGKPPQWPAVLVRELHVSPSWGRKITAVCLRPLTIISIPYSAAIVKGIRLLMLGVAVDRKHTQGEQRTESPWCSLHRPGYDNPRPGLSNMLPSHSEECDKLSFHVNPTHREQHPVMMPKCLAILSLPVGQRATARQCHHS